MPPRFSTRQLNAFIAAAELANFTLAARRLNLTPSAISYLIGDLEAALEFPLFERTTRKVVLTPEGRKFLPSALAVQQQISRAAVAAVDIRNRAVDVVRVAAPMSIAALLLPPLIAAYREIRPRTVIRIIDTGVEWLADRVQIGEVDMALGPDRPTAQDIDRLALFTTAWVMWCRPDHPLAHSGSDVAWSDLSGTDVYAAGRDHEHSVFPNLPADTARVEPVQVVDNLSTALGIAAAGVGLTFSPDYVSGFAQALGLVKRTLINPHLKRQVAIYRPAQRQLSPAAMQVAEFLCEQLAVTK